MEAFDFAFSPVDEPELEVLRTLTLTGKVLQVFSLQEWKSQSVSQSVSQSYARRRIDT